MLKSDTNLHKDIVDELAFDPSVDERGIGVAVRDGVVTLTGTVPSYAQKIAAEKAVRRVSGVHGIAEELKIDLPAFHKRTDSDIAAAALDALHWSTTVPADAVIVKVESGWVTLGGTVDWQYQREAARLAVGSLAGVTGITNDIKLRERVAVGDVKAEIRNSFRRNAEIDADRISVDTADGTVTLRGSVHSWNEHEDATLAAYSVPGVLRVKNLTTVA